MTKNQLGNITLINGDCVEYMRNLPDNAFSLAVVDPPYGSASRDCAETGGGIQPLRRVVRPIQDNPPKSATCRGGSRDTESPTYRRFGNKNSRFQRYELPPPTQNTESQCGNKVDIEWDIAPTPEYFEQLFRVSENQVIWGANYFPNMPPTRCFLVWRKLTISEKFSMAMAEYAWTSFFSNAKVFECAPQGKANDPRFHPTAKPIELYKWVFSNFAKESDTILDTHLGSGSSAIAAHQLGLKLTGIEINEYYYQKAKERIQRYQSQLTLF